MRRRRAVRAHDSREQKCCARDWPGLVTNKVGSVVSRTPDRSALAGGNSTFSASRAHMEIELMIPDGFMYSCVNTLAVSVLDLAVDDAQVLLKRLHQAADRRPVLAEHCPGRAPVVQVSQRLVVDAIHVVSVRSCGSRAGATQSISRSCNHRFSAECPAGRFVASPGHCASQPSAHLAFVRPVMIWIWSSTT